MPSSEVSDGARTFYAKIPEDTFGNKRISPIPVHQGDYTKKEPFAGRMEFTHIFYLRRICRAKFLGRFFNHTSTTSQPLAKGFVRRRPNARPAPDLLTRPAVCGHPTGMILTRAHRSSDLLRKRASPGGYFTRALYAGGQNHAGPANLLSRDSRLSGLGSPQCQTSLPH